MPVVLLTDALIYALILLALGFGLYGSRHEHLREPWRRVGRSSVGVSALVILGFYVVVGLLDTVHFHPREAEPTDSGAEVYLPEVLSLLDLWLTPLRERQEKTYSAPFATHLFAKESIELPDGRMIRDYPRLQWGGSHLEDPKNDRLPDILRTTLVGLIKGLICWALVAALLVWLLARRSGEGFRRTLDVVLDRQLSRCKAQGQHDRQC